MSEPTKTAPTFPNLATERNSGIVRVSIKGGTVVISSDEEFLTLERALFLLDAAKDYCKREW